MSSVNRFRMPAFRMPARSAALLLLALVTAPLFAGEFSFFGTTDKDPLTYAPGEEIVFRVQLLDDGTPCAGKTVRWLRTGDDGKTEEGEAITAADQPVDIRTAIETPGFVWLKVVVLDESGKNIPGENHEFNGGAGVLLDRLGSAPEPDDFDAFWQRQKERLAEVPLSAHLSEVDSPDQNVKCYDLRVDSVGAPVSGYFCLPADAEEKSLPALLVLQGYGVASASKEICAGKSSLALCINAHGIENGRDADFYQNLFNTTLKSYGLPAGTNTDPETSYWNGVAMRVMRALEFLKSLPEWDGKNITVTGGSQGGFQSILAAGLDPDVTSERPLVLRCFGNRSPEAERLNFQARMDRRARLLRRRKSRQTNQVPRNDLRRIGGLRLSPLGRHDPLQQPQRPGHTRFHPGKHSRLQHERRAEIPYREEYVRYTAKCCGHSFRGQPLGESG